MRTSLHGPRAEPRRVKRIALLPLLVGVLVPKCPVCLAVYLSAIGTGASAAHGAAPLVVQAGNALVAIALVVLGLRVVRSRRAGMIALFALSAAALLVLAWAFPLLLWPRLAALTGAGVSFLCTRRVTRPASTRAPQTPAPETTSPAGSPSSQAGFTTRGQKRFVYHRLRRE
jgi:hypothetical protein